MRHFELQGHRGARGLKPENTLPGFEVAFDIGVTSVETDVHLTRDGVPVLCHDPLLPGKVARPLVGAADPPSGLPLRGLSLAELRRYRVDQNPRRFPTQDTSVTPAARLFAERHALDPFGPPTLADLFLFAEEYACDLGVAAGKTYAQRAKAGGVLFDLELKRVPFRPQNIGDDFDGIAPSLLERQVVKAVRAAGMEGRTRVRSFDHRSVGAVRRLEPRLTGAVLVADTAPVDPLQLARAAEARVYCPAVEFLDELQVRHLRAGAVRVLPWTVNDPADWLRLIDWGVDGITTDYPDRLAETLRSRGLEF